MAKTTSRQATRASRAQSYFPVKIPIYSLSGGVGRQIPSKRLPTEVDELINFQCTTESSLTKRNGTEVVGNLIENIEPVSAGFHEVELTQFFEPDTSSLFFYWQTIDNETSRLYLILGEDAYRDGYTIDPVPEDYVKVFEIKLSENSIASVDPGSLDWDSIHYLHHSSISSSKPLRERLKAVTIGSAVLILNTEVAAGFTSRLDGTDGDIMDVHPDGPSTKIWHKYGNLKDYNGDALLHGDVGDEMYDVVGNDFACQYKTSVAVDHKHNAEVWVESQDYTYSQQVIAPQDPVHNPDEDSDEYPFGEFRGKIWDEGRSQRGGQLRFDFTSPVLHRRFLDDDGAGPDGWYDDETVDSADIDVGNQITLVGINEDGDSVTRTYIFCRGVDNGDILRDPDDPIDPPHVDTPQLTDDWDVRGRCIAVDGFVAEQRANGFGDAAALAEAINSSGGHGESVVDEDDMSLIAYANQISVEDTTEYPGRVIIQQRWGIHGEQTNTSVWTNDYYDADDEPPTASTLRKVTYNLNLHTKSSIANTFSGGGDPSIHDIFVPTWDGDTGTNDYWAGQVVDGGVGGNNVLRNQIERRHGIWQVKTYLPAEELPGPTNELLADDEESRGSTVSPHLDLKRWERVESEDSDLIDLNVHTSSFIPVEDYIYPVSASAYLGQSVTKFSDLRFPPDESDLKAHNGVGGNPWAGYIADPESWDANENALTALYPDDDQEHEGYPNAYKGRGKIYHLSQAYLNNTPGWYRVINKDAAPYLKKVRTPGKRTVLDKKRMPQLLYVDNEDTYNIRPVEWDPRESGDEDSNRGPGIFFDPSTEKPKESKINSMAFYRDRLFLANDDTIIASRAGNWDNFFLADPDNITDTDPLDLMVSSNNYTPITQLVPFRDTLFVGTSGNTQYELRGSNNIISPATAEFASTAFYPMLPEVAPVLLNNSLFFFSKEKLYVYLGGRKVAAEQAFELSKHVPQYLPKEIRDTTTSSHASSIFAIDNEIDDTIYVYRNQIAGEKVIQNAFYKFRVGLSSEIQPYFDTTYNFQQYLSHLQAWDKYLYVIKLDYRGDFMGLEEASLNLCRLSLDEEPINIPRLDNLRVIDLEEADVEYKPNTNRTEISLPWSPTKADTIVTTEIDEYFPPHILKDEGGDIIRLRYEGRNNEDETNILDLYSIAGDYASSGYYELFKYIGNTFISTSTLSPIYVRDEMNNLVPGTLNLRYGTIQTYNSRAFDVEVSVNNRNQITHNFEHEISDDRWVDDYIGKNTLSGDISEHQVRFPILGFTEDVKITIISSNPHPLNIASLQFSGKFKGITRFHNS